MHHPGPPQFLAVGEHVQLAPRDPDPEATYAWSVASAPEGSDLAFGDDAVVEFVADVPGRYVLRLEAPDGTHELTIRAFPGSMAPAGSPGAAGRSGYSGYSGFSGISGVSGISGISGISGASGSGSGALGAQRAGEGGRPRIQLRAVVEGDDVVVRGDPTPHPDDPRDPDELNVEFLIDDRDRVHLDESAVSIDGRELRVPIAALPERLRVHGVALADTYSVADAVEVRREEVATDGGHPFDDRGVQTGDGPRTDGGTATSSDAAAESGSAVGAETDADVGDAVATRRLNDPPEWATDVTLYEIYVREFASDVEDADTTFDAIASRLDYLEELGVDVLWLTPVLQNDHADHGYNIVDFHSIAEDLGTREDYERFVEMAHERGMKVLFDLVLNHSAREHPYFKDAYKNPDSEYYDWYEWQDDGEPGTYFDWEYIANFDHTTLEVRRYLLDAVDKWAEIADGFRCDMAWAVPTTLWQEVRDRVKETDPEFLLLDETIPYIADFHELCFDVHFDTTLYFTLREVGNGNMDADAVLDAVEQRAEVGFPDHAAFMLYLENHDETRYVVECGDGATFAAAGALFTLPGIPMLYGGQEFGQRGRRDALAWDHAREELHDHYERLVDARKELEPLRYGGGFSRVAFDANSPRVVAFRRSSGDESYVVVLNFGDLPAKVEFAETSVDATDALTGELQLDDDGDLAVESVAILPEE
jgi:glycosidase